MRGQEENAIRSVYFPMKGMMRIRVRKAMVIFDAFQWPDYDADRHAR
jgi:hypothetical protein